MAAQQIQILSVPYLLNYYRDITAIANYHYQKRYALGCARPALQQGLYAPNDAPSSC
jgi:hypothetical protein